MIYLPTALPSAKIATSRDDRSRASVILSTMAIAKRQHQPVHMQLMGHHVNAVYGFNYYFSAEPLSDCVRTYMQLNYTLVVVTHVFHASAVPFSFPHSTPVSTREDPSYTSAP